MSKQEVQSEGQMPKQGIQNEAEISKVKSHSRISKKKEFTLPPNFALRTGLMCIGILLMGLMLSVLMKLNLGTDPYSCFVKGFSGQVGISYGNAQLLVQLVLFVFVVLFARNLIGIGMIANMVFLGYITDFGTYVLDRFVAESAWEIAAVRYGLLIPALAVFIFGAALYMAVDLGMSPYDGMPFLITDFLNFLLKKQDEAGRRVDLKDTQSKGDGKLSQTGATGQEEISVEKRKNREVPFRVVRMVWDFTFMTLGYFLGGIFGAVTVLQMLFLGTAISWVRKKIEPLLEEKTA
ncbi:MAG: hypothetical protein LUE29_02340 [Lachnospiraceae bacterium]|nr:hypothetical protein [Lachnospiraceae bacterium]